jgi:hypothetical protein
VHRERAKTPTIAADAISITDRLSWRVGFFINVPIGLAAMLAAPRHLEESERRPGRFNVTGGVISTLGASLPVYGTVRSASAGWEDTVTVTAVAAGVGLLALFVADQARAAQPVLPLRLFASRERAGAAGGLVSVVHHLGGAVGLGILVTVFTAAGPRTADARELLADRVSAALTGAAVLLALALLVALIIRPRQIASPVAETVGA